MNRMGRPAPAAGVGNERKADTGFIDKKSPSRSGISEAKVKKAGGGGGGGSSKIGPGDTAISGACAELHRQHPHGHMDTSPKQHKRVKGY